MTHDLAFLVLPRAKAARPRPGGESPLAWNTPGREGGWVDRVPVRGRPLFAAGKVLASPGHGRLLRGGGTRKGARPPKGHRPVTGVGEFSNGRPLPPT